MNKISRRDFINGTAVGLGAAAAVPHFAAKANTTEYYPPALTGLRGSHPGANTHAHNLAWQSSYKVSSVRNTNEAYDLVVVGAGLSGLASAYFYRQRFGPDSKILILDNHDDFGAMPSAMSTPSTASGSFLMAALKRWWSHGQPA